MDKLREAIRDYYVSEFEMEWNDAEHDVQGDVCGLAATDVYDADGDVHNLEVDINIPDLTLIYCDGFDGVSKDGNYKPHEIAREKCTLEGLVDRLGGYYFKDWISDCKGAVSEAYGTTWER